MTIKLKCSTWDELIELIGNILNTEMAKNGKNVQKTAETDTKQQETDTKPTETVPVPAITEAAAAPTAPTTTPVTQVPTKAVTRQDVQNKAISLMDAGKKEQLQGLLKKYNVQALPSVPEDKLAEFMADLEAV